MERDSPGRSPRRTGLPPRSALLLASLILTTTNVLLIVSVVLNVVGPLGALDAGNAAWTALTADLLGMALLAWALLGSARFAAGASRRNRRLAAWLLLAWIALTAYWRFLLPMAAGTHLEALFVGLLSDPGALPPWLAKDAGYVLEMMGIWVVAAAAFVVAHVLLAVEYRRASEDDWVRGLPVYAWLTASLLSFGATLILAPAFAEVAQGGTFSAAFTAAAVTKLILAPNLFLSGYASSLRLALELRRPRADGTRAEA